MFTSMTGHGEAKGDGDGFEIEMEVRSVNHRFLRISSKMSDEIAYLLPELEAEIRRRVSRGSVSLTVRFTPTRTSEFYEIDPDVVRKYFHTLRSLSDEFKTGEKIFLKDLLLLPGAVRVEEKGPAEKEAILSAAMQGLSAALDHMDAMREREGGVLHREFGERWAHLVKLLERVRSLAPQAIAEYQERLNERVRQLLANHEISLTPEDVLKEVAIVAERSDIAEEITRSKSHLEQFKECLDSEGTVGRKLEFIIQEMFREANTMASKSIHPELNRILVDFKSELDRLKEQVQNLE